MQINLLKASVWANKIAFGIKKFSTMAQSTFNQRFKKILQHYDISSTEAARRINVSRQVSDSYLKDSIPRLDTLVLILQTFPELNIEWVLFGKGEMLKDGHDGVNEPEKDYGEFVRKSDYERLEKLFDVMREELENCRQELRDLKGGSKTKAAG